MELQRRARSCSRLPDLTNRTILSSRSHALSEAVSLSATCWCAVWHGSQVQLPWPRVYATRATPDEATASSPHEPKIRAPSGPIRTRLVSKSDWY